MGKPEQKGTGRNELAGVKPNAMPQKKMGPNAVNGNSRPLPEEEYLTPNQLAGKEAFNKWYKK